MHSLFISAACCAAMFLVQTDLDPIRIHKEARQLSKRRVQDIARLAGSTGKRAWLLVGDTSQTLPETRFIDAYLEPDVTGASIRRGRVVHLESLIVNGTAIQWRVRSGNGQYAQVGRESNHWRRWLDDRSIERPFIVDGQFSDQELISLVSFVRGSPEGGRKVDPDGTIHVELPGADGTLPITVVSREQSGVVVFLESSTRWGQTLTLTRNRGTWKLVSVTFGIAMFADDPAWSAGWPLPTKSAPPVPTRAAAPSSPTTRIGQPHEWFDVSVARC
jgi:hypothetical protein